MEMDAEELSWWIGEALSFEERRAKSLSEDLDG